MKNSWQERCSASLLRGVVGCLVVALGAMLAFKAAANEDERWDALAETPFRSITQDDGLALPFVMSIAEDGDGYIWAGTQDGLARWDGYHLVRYRHGAGANTLPDSYILALHRDRRGWLWIGTETGGLTRYDSACNCFANFSAAPGTLSAGSVSAIEDDGGNGLWLATSHGLVHLDVYSGQIISPDMQSVPSSMPPAQTKRLLRDSLGRLWVGTERGLARLDFGVDRTHPLAFVAVKGITDEVRSLYEDADGLIWVGTDRTGAYVLDPRTGTAKQLHESNPDSDFTSERVDAIAASDGEVWLATSTLGIVAVNKTGHTRRMRHDRTLSSTVADDYVTGLLKDRAGAMWAGTARGLNRCDDSTGAIRTIFGESSRKSGLSGTDVFTLMSRPDGRVWAGLRQGGIDILDPSSGHVRTVRADARHSDSALPVTRIYALAPTTSGTVRIGTDRGIYVMDPVHEWIVHQSLPGPRPDAIALDLVDAFGARWIGTDGDGVWMLPLAAGSARTPEHFEADRLTDARVQVVRPGAAGDMWIGTANGLNRLDLKSRAIESLRPDPLDPGSLSAAFISTLLVDRGGRLWVGTAGGGINVLMSRAEGRPRFKHIGIAQGLSNDNIDCLLADEAGRIWASTDDGLAVIDPETFAVRTLRRPEGVQIADYTGNSGARTPAGELLFGGEGGITVIRPDRLVDPNDRPPPLVVTGVWVGGSRVSGGAFGAAQRHEAIVVPPDSNSLAVEFSALDFSAPRTNQYAYSLQGFDHGWNETDAGRRLASYTNLPPGSYRLRLRGSRQDGLSTARTMTLAVEVLPAWYQTWWCRLLAVLLAGLVLRWIMERRTALLRRRQSELTQQVADRTADLLESQRQLEAIAYIDMLTGLPNRRRFTEDLRTSMARAAQGQGRLGLLLLDLDRFKGINDTLGHDAGDALLIEAGARFKASVRESDIVARLGGDEFAVLLLDSCDRPSIEQICARIIEHFGPPVAFKAASMRTTPSIGVAVYPDDGNTEETLLKAADLALYAAKGAGANTWRWYGAPTAELAVQFQCAIP